MGMLTLLSLTQGGAMSRERLAGLLWSDRGEEQARHSLRQCLLNLRKELGETCSAAIVSTQDEVRLDRSRVRVDAWGFDSLVGEGTPEALREALELFRGELADGLAVRSEGFEEWLSAQRVHWRQRCVDVAAKLIGLLTESGDAEAGLEVAHKLLAVEPANEEAHRALMVFYARLGRRASALQQYQLCVDAMRRHLDAEPDEETRRLYDELRRTTPSPSPDLGIAEAVAVEAASTGEGDVAQASDPTDASRFPQASPLAIGASPRMSFAIGRRRMALLAASGAAVLAGVALIVAFVLFPTDRIAPADPAAMAFALPEKPSIAVLPFRDISDGGGPSGLTQGMTEDITTALASIPEIFVIAPSAARAYADETETPGRIAEALGVRWVLDGSIQRIEDRVRISAQLIDALRGAQVWADRYDRAIEDVFELQDEITLKIVATLEVTLARGEAPPRTQKHGTRNLDAWLAASEGLGLLRRLTPGENQRARALYLRAGELDPKYPAAWEGLAWTYYIEARFNWTDDPATALAKAAELIQKSIELDPTRGRSYSLLGSIMLIRRQFPAAVSYGERAIQISPSDSEAMALLANTLSYTSALDRGLAVMEKAMRLSPSFPDWYAWNMARILRMTGKPAEAVEMIDGHLASTDEAIAPRIELILALVQMGDLARARREAEAVAAIEPRFTTQRWMMVQPYAEPSVAISEAALLQQAGLPS